MLHPGTFTTQFVVVLSMIFFASGCGKKVVNPAKKQAGNAQGAGQEGDANAAKGGPDTQKDIDELRDLLDKEREDRIKGDADLQAQIDALLQQLVDMQSKLALDIAALDKQGKDNQTALLEYIKVNEKVISDLSEELKAADQTLAKDLRDEFNKELQMLKDELINADAAQKIILEEMIAALETKLTTADAKLAADLRAEITVNIKRTEELITAFKTEVAVTYATKAELQVLAASVESIRDSLVIITKKFDVKLQDLQDKIFEEHRKDVLALQTQIDALSLDVTKIETNVAALNKSLNKKIADLRAEMRSEISSLKIEITQLQKQDALQIATIKSLSKKLNARIEFVFKFFAAVTIELTDKIEKLEQSIDEVAEDQKEYVQSQIVELEKKITDLAEEERQARAELEAAIRDIVAQIERLETFAKENRNLILANRLNLEKTNADLEKAKVEFYKELNQLRDEFSARLEAVRQMSITITANLGIQIQQQFVQINARLAAINQRITAQMRLIVFVLVELIGKDEAKSKPVEAFLTSKIPLLTNDLKQIGHDRSALEQEIINIISPFAPAAGVIPQVLNSEFRQLLADHSCDGFPGEGDLQAALNDREWFAHVAGAYAGLLASGLRSGHAEIDRIFFGQTSGVGSQDSISSTLLAAVLAPYATGSGCERPVNAWSRSQIIGSGAQAKAIRTAIAGSTKIKALATRFSATVLAYKTVADQFEDELISTLVAAGLDRDLIRTWLYTEVDNIRPIDRIVSYMLDIVEDARQLAEIDANRDRIFSLAKNVAAQQEQIGQVRRTVAQLSEDFETLQAQVIKLSQCVTDVKKDIVTLKTSQIAAFNLIAEIAARLGFDDIVERADDEIIDLGGTPGSRVPDGCYGVQHFYNHATNKQIPVGRCESLLTTFDKQLSNSELTKCAIHGGFLRNNELIGYTWGNESFVTNGWNARNQTIGGHKVSDGLLVRQYNPTDAKAVQLAGRPAGGAYPADGESTLVYRILGNAASFQIAVRSEADASKYPYDVTVNAADYLKGQADGLNVYEIPLPKAIGKLGACTWNRKVKITAFSAAGAAGKNVCEHRFHTFSPIVLNLAGRGLVKTLPPTDSQVRFDLDANGIADRTGWISGNSALLARDLNGNGRIDDGSELFGEATLVGARTAENGYKALAALDDNKDGVVDLADKAFSELLVWKDLNRDGVSQPHELKSASALGITAFATDYKSVAAEDQLQADASGNEANLIKYQSTFRMPGCGDAGCSSFDVYFGSSEYTTAAK